MATAIAMTYGHLADLALGSIEVGAVNFNILHTLIHLMLDKLGLTDQTAEVTDSVLASINHQPTGSADHTARHSAVHAARHSADHAVSHVHMEEDEDLVSVNSHHSRVSNTAAGEVPMTITGDTLLDVTNIASPDANPNLKKTIALGNKNKAYLGILTPTGGSQLSISVAGAGTNTSLMRDISVHRNIDTRLTQLEEFFENINKLSTAFGHEHREPSTGIPSRPLAEHWQATQFQKKMDANTLGIDRLCELFEDLKFANEKLVDRLNEHKNVVSDEEIRLLRDMVKHDGWSECCKSLQNQMSLMEKKVQWIPTPHFLSNFATWHGLEELFEGDDHDWKITSNKIKKHNVADITNKMALDAFTEEELGQTTNKSGKDESDLGDQDTGLAGTPKNQALKTANESGNHNVSNNSSRKKEAGNKNRSNSSRVRRSSNSSISSVSRTSSRTSVSSFYSERSSRSWLRAKNTNNQNTSAGDNPVEETDVEISLGAGRQHNSNEAATGGVKFMDPKEAGKTVGVTLSAKSSETCDIDNETREIPEHTDEGSTSPAVHTPAPPEDDDDDGDEEEEEKQDKSVGFSFRASFGGFLHGDGTGGGGGEERHSTAANRGSDASRQNGGSMWRTSDWSRMSQAAMMIRTGLSYVEPGKDGGKTKFLSQPLGPSKALHWTMGSLGELVKKLDELADLKDRISELEEQMELKADRESLKNMLNEILVEREQEMEKNSHFEGGSEDGEDGLDKLGGAGGEVFAKMTPAELNREVRVLKQQMADIQLMKEQLQESHIPDLANIGPLAKVLPAPRPPTQQEGEPEKSKQPRFTAFSMLERATKGIDDHFGKMDRAFKELARHLRCEMRAQENRLKSYGQAAAGVANDPYALNASCEPIEDRTRMETNDRFMMLEKSMGVKGMELHGVQIKIAMVNQDINRQLSEMRDKMCKVNNRLFRISQGVSAAKQRQEAMRLKANDGEGGENSADCKDGAIPIKVDDDDQQCGGDLGPEFMEAGPMKEFMESLQKLNTDVAGIVCSNEALSEDNGKIQTTLMSILRFNEDVKKSMVTKDQFRGEISLKADKVEMDKKASINAFDAAISDLELQCDALAKKITDTEGRWRETFDTLCSDLNNTVTLEEFEAVKDLVDDHLRLLAKKLQKAQRFGGGSGAGPTSPTPASGGATDTAAAMRQMSEGHGHCLSCDRPLQFSKDPRPSIPYKDGMMPPKSIKPYTTYELEQIRQQSKGYGPAHLSNFERAMMERQLTRIKIRDLRSDYANYWRNQDTCSAGPRGTKTVKKTKGVQAPSVEKMEIYAQIPAKKSCGVQNSCKTAYLKSIPVSDIGAMFSDEDLHKHGGQHDPQMPSVGHPMRWDSATSLVSDGGKGSVKDSFGGAYKISRARHRDSFGGHDSSHRPQSTGSISSAGSKGSGPPSRVGKTSSKGSSGSKVQDSKAGSKDRMSVASKGSKGSKNTAESAVTSATSATSASKATSGSSDKKSRESMRISTGERHGAPDIIEPIEEEAGGPPAEAPLSEAPSVEAPPSEVSPEEAPPEEAPPGPQEEEEEPSDLPTA